MMGEIDETRNGAAQWLIREDRGLDLREREAFERWFDESAAHRVAYLRLKATWRRMDGLAGLQNPGRTFQAARSGFSPRAFQWAAAAVMFLCLGVAGYFYFHLRSSSVQTAIVYATVVGQQETHRLADGTVIELNTDTRLRVQETKSARTVVLERGEAYFDVVHDAQRPFVVIADNRAITDIGTRFSVRDDGNQLQVVVSAGRIRIDALKAAQASVPIFANRNNIVLVRANETLLLTRTPQDIERQLSWKHGMLIFQHTTLADAAAEFNRYNQKHIVVLGKARDIRIGGSFREKDIDTFALLLQKGFDVRVTNDAAQIVISDE